MAFFIVPPACFVIGCILWQVFTAEAPVSHLTPSDPDQVCGRGESDEHFPPD